jgi:hypothetical protein
MFIVTHLVNFPSSVGAAYPRPDNSGTRFTCPLPQTPSKPTRQHDSLQDFAPAGVFLYEKQNMPAI